MKENSYSLETTSLPHENKNRNRNKSNRTYVKTRRHQERLEDWRQVIDRQIDSFSEKCISHRNSSE